jgi:hypothetical protein
MKILQLENPFNCKMIVIFIFLVANLRYGGEKMSIDYQTLINGI